MVRAYEQKEEGKPYESNNRMETIRKANNWQINVKMDRTDGGGIKENGNTRLWKKSNGQGRMEKNSRTSKDPLETIKRKQKKK